MQRAPTSMRLHYAKLIVPFWRRCSTKRRADLCHAPPPGMPRTTAAGRGAATAAGFGVCCYRLRRTRRPHRQQRAHAGAGAPRAIGCAVGWGLLYWRHGPGSYDALLLLSCVSCIVHVVRVPAAARTRVAKRKSFLQVDGAGTLSASPLSRSLVDVRGATRRKPRWTAK
eukprot:6301291-Prymnesium_polylepis.1